MANEKSNPKLMTIASLLILSIGSFLRLYHLGVVGFTSPWTLGGLYLEFSRQIFLNHYALPTTIPNYSLGGLPFAYPPLPFYFEAFFAFTLGLPKFLVTNALPPLVGFLALVAFFRLTKKIIQNPLVRLLALALYAILPLSFMDQVEAAGLAESFGALFIILLLDAFWEFTQSPNDKKKLFLAATIWAFCITASPASAYVSVFIFFSFFLKLLKQEKGRIKQLLLNILLLGGTAVILSSVYWGVVLWKHGLAFFIESFTGQHTAYINFLLNALLSIHQFSRAPISAIFPLLFIFTLCVLIYFRQYSTLLLLVLASLVPRELWIMGIIGVVFLGFALDLMILKRQARELPPRKKWLPYIILLPLIVILAAVDSLHFCLNRELISPDTILSNDQIALLENIDAINPTQADLVVIGAETFFEWAPYLSQTTVLNEWYGTEFAPEKAWLVSFNESLIACPDLHCINQLIRENFSQSALVLIDVNALPELDLSIDAGEISEYQDSGIYYYYLD
ncbi:hypothetical protein JR338_10530 [Chloroflexota bacterium]|nr:hypothetical protein JR338_10530 [Chloroflexota bacterium]